MKTTINPFSSVFSGLSKDGVKKLFRQLAQQYHPDHGGKTSDMQALNSAYQYALLHARNEARAKDEPKAPKMNTSELPESAVIALSKIKNLPGLIVEIVGQWVWVSGNTKAHKDALKAAGFLWACKKKQWYFKGCEARSHSYVPYEVIREKYGASRVNPDPELA